MPPTAFLSRASAAHAASRSTLTGSGRSVSSTAFVSRPESRSAARSPSADGPAVRKLEAGRRLQRVRERVAEVELRALAAVVRVAEAERRLEGGCSSHLLVERQLPDRLAHEQPRLHHLGATVRQLARRERLERGGIDHRPDGPVEGADDVLRAREVDRRLAADRGVDLADERRRHGDPVDPAEVARSRESCDVGGAAAAERDERARALEPKRVPERLDRLDRLRLLAGRELVDRAGAGAEGELDVHPVDPGNPRVADDLDLPVARDELAEPLERAGLDVDAAGGEDGALEIGACARRPQRRRAAAAARTASGTPPRPAQAAGRRPRRGARPPPASTSTRIVSARSRSAFWI